MADRIGQIKSYVNLNLLSTPYKVGSVYYSVYSLSQPLEVDHSGKAKGENRYFMV